MEKKDDHIIFNMSVSEFQRHLETNRGLLLIKFGATWCKPCRLIQDVVHEYFTNVPDTVTCAILDVDQNIELYGYLKKNRITYGIPCILCYVKKETPPFGIMPTDSITGADINELHMFFSRCRSRLLEMAR